MFIESDEAIVPREGIGIRIDSLLFEERPSPEHQHVC